MKNFLRILAVIFLLVVVIIIIKSGVLSGGADTTDSSVSNDSTVVDGSEETEPTISETEEAIQEIIDPAPQEEGVVILGGDGIPNN